MVKFRIETRVSTHGGASHSLGQGRQCVAVAARVTCPAHPACSVLLTLQWILQSAVWPALQTLQHSAVFRITPSDSTSQSSRETFYQHLKWDGSEERFQRATLGLGVPPLILSQARCLYLLVINIGPNVFETSVSSSMLSCWRCCPETRSLFVVNLDLVRECSREPTVTAQMRPQWSQTLPILIKLKHIRGPNQ